MPSRTAIQRLQTSKCSASNGFYPVLDGLNLNDEVVKEGSFILKAEAIRQHPEL